MLCCVKSEAIGVIMKQFTTPGLKETAVKLRITLTKSRKAVGRANLEAIRARLQENVLDAKRG